MLRVGVISKNAGDIITMLNRLFTGTEYNVCLPPAACDILVADGGVSHDTVLPACFALVVNSDDEESEAAALGFIEKGPALVPVGIVITYGLNKKACVTASSVTDDSCAICVQRAFPTLSGGRCLQGEFTIKLPDGVSLPVSAVLAAAAVGLVWDVLP